MQQDTRRQRTSRTSCSSDPAGQQAAEEQQALLQASLQAQLAAATSGRDSSLRKLRRLQNDVSDAEALLTSFLGSGGSSSTSVFDTPAASQPRSAPRSPAAADAADAATAVQWLQQTQQQQGSSAAAAASESAAGSSRLTRRIQAVLLELQKLQQQQLPLEGDGSTPEDATPAPAAAEQAEARAGSKLPLLTPAQSEDAGSALIAAIHGTPSAAAAVQQAYGAGEATSAAADEAYWLRSYPVQVRLQAAFYVPGLPSHAP